MQFSWGMKNDSEAFIHEIFSHHALLERISGVINGVSHTSCEIVAIQDSDLEYDSVDLEEFISRFTRMTQMLSTVRDSQPTAHGECSILEHFVE